METVRTIIIHAREVKNDKQKFISCSAEINGKWYKIKFTKNVADNPKFRGLYELTIDFDNCSVETGGYYEGKNGDTRKDNDTIWVDHIVGIRKFSDEDMKNINRAKLGEIFGE